MESMFKKDLITYLLTKDKIVLSKMTAVIKGKTLNRLVGIDGYL